MGLEDQLHIQTHNFLSLSRLHDVIFYSYMPFGENRTPKTGAFLKKKGTKKGVPDYLIRKKEGSTCRNIYLEAKTIKKGIQTKEQREFQESCNLCDNEVYYLYRTIEELQDILKKEKILKDL